jgi:DNA-binding transcriptional LysR family regulator
MQLAQIRALKAISKLGSISLAADHLHLSPPAIHKQLKDLAVELGVPLYSRVGKRLQLTQAAELLLPFLNEMLAQYTAALSALEEWKGAKSGSVRVGAGATSYILHVLLRKFRRTYPGVELFVETANDLVLLDSLDNRSLDLALVVTAELIGRAGITVEASWDYQLVLISHKRDFPHKPHLADLKNLPFILFRKQSRFEELVSSYFAMHGLKPNVIMRFDNGEFIKSMVLAGLGISALPLWLVHKEVTHRRLSIIHQVEPPLYANISLIRRDSGYVSRPVQAFIDIARSLTERDLRPLTMQHPGTINSRKSEMARTPLG